MNSAAAATLTIARGRTIFLNKMHFPRFVKLEGLGHLSYSVKRDEVEKVLNQVTYTDWLILYYLAAALNRENFGALIANLASGGLPKYDEGMEDDRYKLFPQKNGRKNIFLNSNLKVLLSPRPSEPHGGDWGRGRAPDGRRRGGR